MPSIRTLPYDPALTSSNRVLWCWFVAITLPSGIVRYARDYASVLSGASATSYSLDPDGNGAHDWFFTTSTPLGGSYGLMVGPISQGDQGSSVVSWVSLIDLNGVIYTLANTVYSDGTVGLCGRPIDIWRSQFDPDALTLSGTTLFFRGKVDSQQYGTRAILSLDPFRTRQREAPWLVASQLGAASLLPDVARTIQFLG